MRRNLFYVCLAATFAIELMFLLAFAMQKEEALQDPVAVNAVVQSVQEDWNLLSEQKSQVHPAEPAHKDQSALDYVVLDMEGQVVFQTVENLRDSIHDAVYHRDTILPVEAEGSTVGTVIIQNQEGKHLLHQRQRLAVIFALAVLVQAAVCLGFVLYWNRVVIKPFESLRGFARRVAQGNLDIPLKMDRQNLFGAFTESFDIMRSELQKARIAEAEANASKKELIAKLSHDIKTPVASIKAVAEVGAARAQGRYSSGNPPMSPKQDQDAEKERDGYLQIIRKADQINTLITNLFTATLEELKQLTVTPTELASSEIQTLLQNADYLHRAKLPKLPPCLVAADPLRLQQVFDNLFANSYKYANTGITVTAAQTRDTLSISLEDFGGGVMPEELPLLKEKFKRGSNSQGIEGAGLGLYLSNYFMEKMGGSLTLENGANGLKTTITLKYI